MRPDLVGRQTEADVLLADSPRPGRWPLRVDTRSPALFDEPCTVRAQPAAAGEVTVTFEQGGRAAAEGMLTLAG